MSVRAHRIKKIDYSNAESFNLWHDTKLVEFLDKEGGFYETLTEGSGIAEVPTEVLKKAVKKAKELELEDWQVKQLKEDIEWGLRGE